MARAICKKCGEVIRWQASRGAKLANLRHQKDRDYYLVDYHKIEIDDCGGELKRATIKDLIELRKMHGE